MHALFQYHGKIYTLLGYDGNRVVIEPVPNPELETEYVPSVKFFAEAIPAPTDGVNEKKAGTTNHGSDQPRISHGSATNQPRISSGSATDQNGTSPKRHVPNPNSVSALETARKHIAKDPYQVMLAYWHVIQEIDRFVGIEKALRFKSFPAKTTHHLNAMFQLRRDKNFYLRLMGYYARYTRMFAVRFSFSRTVFGRNIQFSAQLRVPMWYIRFEIMLEKIFQTIED